MERTLDGAESLEILVVDDIPAMTKRIAGILRGAQAGAVVREAWSGAGAVAEARSRRPDVVLMDLEMETRRAGLDAAREILSAFPDVKIVMLTVYEDADLIAEAFRVGAVNYLLKDASADDIRRTVTEARDGRSRIIPEVSRILIDGFVKSRREEERLRYFADSVSRLSSTESEILKLLCAGKSRQAICEERGVEESTVKTQIRSMLLKLKLKNTKQAVSAVKDFDLASLIR